MIHRTSARKLETTLVSCSRQALPRPARFYSTPTKKAAAPALAQLPLPASEFSSHTYAPPPSHSERDGHLKRFLARRPKFTMLPTPLPDDKGSKLNDFYFPDSPTQDLIAVMDACLHNSYDVPRAKQIFENMRVTKPGDPLLDVRVFNRFLEAFVQMAGGKGADDKHYWIKSAWDTFEVMQTGKESVAPNISSYAVMLMAWIRHNPESPDTPYTPPYGLKDILCQMVDRKIPVVSVVADRALSDSKEAQDIIQMLSSAATELNLLEVVFELGEARKEGSFPDPIADVAEVSPVLKAKPRAPGEEGEVTEPEMEVPFNLDNLRRHLAKVQLARRVLPEDATARQTLLEASVHEVAAARFKHEDAMFKSLGLGASLQERTLQAWMWQWHQALTTKLTTVIKDIVRIESEPGYRLKGNKTGGAAERLGAFLSLLKAEKLSLITIMELMRLHGSGGITDGMKTARALLAVGKGVENEYKARMCKMHGIAVPKASDIGRGERGVFTEMGYNNLRERRELMSRYSEDKETWLAPWVDETRVRVGSILVDALMDTATVERTAVDKRTGETVSEHQPAFHHSYEYSRGHKLGVIKLNQVIAARMASDGLRETLHPRHLPMLVTPKPWLSDEDGGYLNNPTQAMRYKDSQEQRAYLKHASSKGHVELVFAGLDVLGSTPWKINRQVFDIVLKVWNEGGRLCKVPPAVYEVAEPQPPEDLHDQKAKSIYLQRMKAWREGKSGNHSERCSVNYKVEIARAFLGDTIYFPHNLDFRGRAYPIPPHLNHLGDDLSRGLLKFGESKPLGVRGLRWLKIHLANLYGFDKANFDERENWVMERLAQVYDSAENPLDGERWWTKADDPWQCLATCIELREALESPDPFAFMSSLPVHQDGTCNGLQHYAALGGDAQGAQQVNLGVTDRPSDVYTFVANMVEEQILIDKEKGNKYAELLSGKVARKIVKQTVMTTVYGVTFIGARDQIEKQLKDRTDLPEEECWSAAAYLAKKVLACIGDLFGGAKGIQTWLNLCARLISKAIPAERVSEAMEVQTRKKGSKGTAVPANRLKKEQMTSVVWTTPLGLPIVQPYRKTKRKQIMTSLQTVFISDPNSPAEVNSLKQASAFPPNFIHSLDATHMMLTALECRAQNLSFASVHDSYWTHASSIDQMSEIIRDTFIALHQSDVLGKLHHEFHQRYAGYKVPLIHLRSGNLMKNLLEAGTTIKASPDQAERLKAGDADLNSLLTVSDTQQSSIDEKEVDLSLIMDSVSATEAKSKSTVTAVEGTEANQEEDDSHPISQADVHLLGKFVELTDLFPPLPQKGTFDVGTIRKSQYFFS